MMRLILIDEQISEDHKDFAFWNTVTDKFVEIYETTVFTSVRDFEECVALAKSVPMLPREQDLLEAHAQRLRELLAGVREQKYVLETDAESWDD